MMYLDEVTFEDLGDIDIDEFARRYPKLSDVGVCSCVNLYLMSLDYDSLGTITSGSFN